MKEQNCAEKNMEFLVASFIIIIMAEAVSWVRSELRVKCIKRPHEYRRNALEKTSNQIARWLRQGTQLTEM